MKKLLLLASCASIIIGIWTTFAKSADIYTKAAPITRQTAYVPYNWTGMYIGFTRPGPFINAVLVAP